MSRPPETGWLPDTPVGDTVLRRYLANQADAQAALVTATGGTVERTDGLVLTDLGVPADLLNEALLLRPLAGPDDPLLGEVDAFYGGRNAAVVLSAWPTPDLATRGWHLVGHPTFVVRTPGPPVVMPGDVAVATTAADLAAAEQVLVDGFPLPESKGLPPNALLGARPSITVRLGRLDGVPVATAANHVAHGVNNLCLAATLPAARRRGVWRALVAARLADAPDLPAAACTSDDSRPGFEAMGFLPVTRLTLWLRPGG